MHMTEVATHQARIDHQCDWCGQRIDAGTQYKRYRWLDGADAATVKMHPECHDAMQEAALDEGGYIEWSDTMERPSPNAISSKKADAEKGEHGQ